MKPAAWLALGLLALALAAGAIWGVFIRPGQKAEQAATATAGAAQAGAQVKAAGDAAAITHTYVEKTREIERVRDVGNAAIGAAAGAGDPLASDVYAAFVGALCMRRAGAGDPACQRLQPDGGPAAAPAEPDGIDSSE